MLLAIISIIVGAYGMFSNPESTPLFYTGVIFLIVAVILIALPNRIAGSWSEKGLTDFKKWKAFRKFITDFSLIKQHPPKSIEIWNKYLVYATALGNAKAVNKALKAIGPVPESSDLYYYSYYGGHLMFSSAISTSRSTVSQSNDGFGGAGGGSGGGGGGAF